MPKEQILDIDPDTGIIRYHSYDEDTDTEYTRTYQDVQAIIDNNKALANEEFDKSANFWPAAEIPWNIIFQWRDEFGIDAMNPDHWPEVKKLLNDPDWRYLRPSEFQL